MTNADIAHRLMALAQMLQANGENSFKVRAYRRAKAAGFAYDGIDSVGNVIAGKAPEARTLFGGVVGGNRREKRSAMAT